MTTHLHILKGCSPAPLANYLKALGILRLVGEQADSQARGWWEGEQFCLLTKLSKEELEAFFLQNYLPTPILSPWNKGCGFFKANDPGLAPLESSIAPRFALFREGVKAGRILIEEIAEADGAIRAIKARAKTTAGLFQSENQRKSLANSVAYRECLNQLATQLTKPDLPQDRRSEIDSDIATVHSIVAKTSNMPDKIESKSLTNTNGYKRLLATANRHFENLKANLISDCQRSWRGRHADWISVAVVLNESREPAWPSLLGTGGNDGNLDFTNSFMRQIGCLFDLTSKSGAANPNAKHLLENALWITPANQMSPTAIGQYQPGAAGGANSSTGFDSGNLVNGWDFVLMMEGALLFTSRATRRLDPNTFSRASAPFAVRSHAAGFATPGSEKAQRGEQWVPIWQQPATLQDVSAMFGEARIQLDRQTANHPVDVARAISRLGVGRGIDAFVRYGYLERNGQSTLAVPLGRIDVPKRQNPRAYLIDDLANWMNSIERRSRDKNAPARFAHAERHLADAAFAALTHDDTPDRWQAILRAAADIEALQATGTAIEAGPIPSLRPEWVAAVDDGSAEVRLALALGSAAADYFKRRPIDPVRSHWLPLESGGRRFKTSDKRLMNDPRVVASGRDPIRDLAALVDRRLIEAGMIGQRKLRLIAARGCGARVDDLAQFLNGSLDLDKLLGIARAFMSIQWERWTKDHCLLVSPSGQMPDEGWLAVRLANLPDKWINDQHIPAEPRIVRLLMSGDSSRAIEIARNRLRSAGIRPPLRIGFTDIATARLWAAALAFPIDWQTANKIAQRLDPRLKPQKGLQYV